MFLDVLTHNSKDHIIISIYANILNIFDYCVAFLSFKYTTTQGTPTHNPYHPNDNIKNEMNVCACVFSAFNFALTILWFSLIRSTSFYQQQGLHHYGFFTTAADFLLNSHSIFTHFSWDIKACNEKILDRTKLIIMHTLFNDRNSSAITV